MRAPLHFYVRAERDGSKGSGAPCQARGDGKWFGLARRLAGELGRDYRSVHRNVALLTATGLIERRAADEVAVGWDRAVTELDLAAWA